MLLWKSTNWNRYYYRYCACDQIAIIDFCINLISKIVIDLTVTYSYLWLEYELDYKVKFHSKQVRANEFLELRCSQGTRHAWRNCRVKNNVFYCSLETEWESKGGKRKQLISSLAWCWKLKVMWIRKKCAEIRRWISISHGSHRGKVCHV